MKMGLEKLRPRFGHPGQQTQDWIEYSKTIREVAKRWCDNVIVVEKDSPGENLIIACGNCDACEANMLILLEKA